MKKLFSLLMFVIAIKTNNHANVLGGGYCKVAYFYQLSNGNEKSEFRSFENNSILTFNIKKGDSIIVELFQQKQGTRCMNTEIHPIAGIYDIKGVSVNDLIYKSEGIYKYKIDNEFYNYPLDSILIKISTRPEIPITFVPRTLISTYRNRALYNSFYFSIENKMTKTENFNLNQDDTIFVPINDKIIVTSTSEYYISNDNKMLKFVENGLFSISLKNGLGYYNINISNPTQEDYFWPCKNFLLVTDTNKFSQYLGRFPIPSIQSKKYYEISALCETTVRLVRFADCQHQIDTLKMYNNVKWYYSLLDTVNAQPVLDWDNKTTIKINKQGFYRCDFTDVDTHYSYRFYYKKLYNDNINAVEESQRSTNAIIIAPNPVNEKINLISNNTGDYTIADCLGQVVNSGNIFSPNMQIDVAALQLGTYILTINSNNKVYHTKFIK